MQVEGQATVSEGEQKPDIDLLTSEIKQLKETNARILDESKTWKSKFQETSSHLTEKAVALEDKERADLVKKGDFEKLLMKSEEGRLKEKNEKEDLKVKTLKSNTKYMISKLAKDSIDLDAIIKLGDMEKLQFDEETMSPTSESTEAYLNDLRENKSYLFGKKLPTSSDAHPRGEVKKQEKTANDVFQNFVQSTHR